MPDEGMLAFADAPAVEAGADQQETITDPQNDTNVLEPTTQDEVDEGAETLDSGEEDKNLKVLPKQIQDGIKAAKDAGLDPKVAKALAAEVGKVQGYAKEFPTVQAAREAKSLIESIGGADGLAEKLSVLQNVEESDALVAAGDERILDQIKEDSPEGFKKLLPGYLARVQQMDAQGFETALKPHFMRSLMNTGLEAALYDLSEGVKAQDVNAVSKITSELVKWYLGIKSEAGKTVQQTTDPNAGAIKSEWDKINNAKDATFRSDVQRSVMQPMNERLGKSLAPYLKGSNLTADQKKDTASAIYAELNSRMSKDTAYQKQMQAFMKSKGRDQGRISAFIKTKIDSIADDVVKSVWTRRYGAFKPKAAAAAAPGTRTAANNTNANTVRVANKPKPDEIDWDKDPKQLLFITGRGYLKKTGQLVKWR